MALGKLPTPEIYISAFAVAKSLMHLAEIPTMMIMMKQTAVVLVEDRESYYRVRKFFFTYTKSCHAYNKYGTRKYPYARIGYFDICGSMGLGIISRIS